MRRLRQALGARGFHGLAFLRAVRTVELALVVVALVVRLTVVVAVLAVEPAPREVAVIELALRGRVFLALAAVLLPLAVGGLPFVAAILRFAAEACLAMNRALLETNQSVVCLGQFQELARAVL